MTRIRAPRRSFSAMAAAIGLAAVFVLPARAPAEPAPPRCGAPADLGRLDRPLSHVAARVALGEPVKIVAIGSSSTFGSGASSTAWSYPSRLEVELKARFPQLSIQVLNRGINGEEVAQMLARFASAVVAEKPDLVIWQVGTNSVLRGHDIRRSAEGIREGLRRLKALGTDVILMDLQFAPQVIEKPDAELMVNLIAAAAKRDDVDLFRRFALMRDWTEARHISFRQSVAPDGLHMNDWSYGCMAKLLAKAIADAATRVPQTAGISSASTAQR
jgi:acyl-CoA thioesterase-1